MFYFEQLLQTALSGIDSTNIMTTVLQVASTILLLSFLYSAYQAFASGGDVRMLAVSSVKYLVLGLVFASYGTIFRAITGMFNSVADFIFSSTGVGDVFSNWMGQLANYWEAQGWSSIWGLITGGISGLLSAIIIIVGFIVYPIAYLLFTVFYALFGSVLYVVGPFVLALLPTRGIGELARTYAVNVMIFGSWGLIYAIIQVLMSAINLNSIDAVLNANGVLNSFIGSGSMILLAIVSVLFSISIALIPYFASRIVRGDVGSTMFALAGTAATAASAAASLAGKALSSGGSGYGSATHKSDGPPPPPPGGGGGGGAPLAGYYSIPPTPASSETPGSSSGSENSPGGGGAPPPIAPKQWGANSSSDQHQKFSFADSLFWWGGYGLGKLSGSGRKQ